MSVSTAKVRIEEHNVHAHIVESVGTIPWDDVSQACAFRNAEIARELFGLNQVEAEGIDQEIPPVRLLDRDAMTFPVGLKQRVTRELQGQGIAVEWIDRTTPPADKFTFVFKGDAPRDYQTRAVDELLGQRFGMLEAPTGSGKTLIEALVIARLGGRTLWVVHSVDLVKQTVEFLDRYFGLQVGIVGAGTFNLKTITVATAQSLRTKWGQIQRRGWIPSLLIEDEVHHAGAWKNFRVLQEIPAYYRYGFSATPDRRTGDRLLLEAAYGHVETKVSMAELTQAGYLAPITVRVKEVQTKIPKGSASWQEVYEIGIVQHEERNRLVAEAVAELRAEGRQVLVDVDQIEHLTQLHIPDSTSVTGEMDAQTRGRIYDRFKKGEIPVLVGTVLREGLDLPAVGAVVLAGGKKSQVQILQQIGRGLRTSAGKQNCIVVDFNDNQHGLLLEHSQTRLKLMRLVGFQVPEDAIRKVEALKISVSGDEIAKIRKRQQDLATAKLGDQAFTREDRGLEKAEAEADRQENNLNLLKRGRDVKDEDLDPDTAPDAEADDAEAEEDEG
jgi:superfamily II DNA or RNA helicase